jgi:hypothetical protein
MPVMISCMLSFSWLRACHLLKELSYQVMEYGLCNYGFIKKRRFFRVKE